MLRQLNCPAEPTYSYIRTIEKEKPPATRRSGRKKGGVGTTKECRQATKKRFQNYTPTQNLALQILGSWRPTEAPAAAVSWAYAFGQAAPRGIGGLTDSRRCSSPGKPSSLRRPYPLREMRQYKLASEARGFRAGLCLALCQALGAGPQDSLR